MDRNLSTSTPSGFGEICYTLITGFKLPKANTTACISDPFHIVYSLVTGKGNPRFSMVDDKEAKNAATPQKILEVAEAAMPKVITLKDLNDLRKAKESNVTILFALPTLPEDARPSIAFLKGSAGREKANVLINGVAYDLWTNWSSWDLERDGGSTGYTFDKAWGDRTHEIWHSQYYLVKQGEQPGESENALDMTGKILDIDGTVYVFFGESFFKQIDAAYYDNNGHQYKQQQVDAARQRALAARN